jgi:hypothetical protein
VALLAISACLVGSCFKDIRAPECGKLSDCPPGYTSCEDGYCFQSAGACGQAALVPGDGCCGVTEGDRSADTDCLLRDLPLGLGAATTPALFHGLAYLSGTLAGGADAGQVAVAQVDLVNGTSLQATVGAGMPLPVTTTAQGVYVACDQGVVHYDAGLNELDVIPSGAPTGGLAANGSTDQPEVGWVTAAGRLELYDESRSVPLELDLPASLGGGPAWAPAVSPDGRRMVVVWETGLVLGIEMTLDPRGPVASTTVAGAGGPPLIVARTVYVAAADGTLTSLEESGDSYQTRWTLGLGGPIAGRLLSDTQGHVLAVLKTGDVRLVKDGGALGAILGMGSFGKAMAGLAPALGADGRVVAFDDGARRVASLLRVTDASGGVQFARGLEFDVGGVVGAPPVLQDDRLVLLTAAGNAQSWVYPTGPAAQGFARDGGDAGNTGRPPGEAAQ